MTQIIKAEKKADQDPKHCLRISVKFYFILEFIFLSWTE